MSDKTKAKELKAKLANKEDELVRTATLYAGRHNMEFDGKHRILLRVVLRNFFTSGIYPLVRDLNEINIDKYHND